ncbi:hypothetical protein CPB86DRAFT_790416 [Serendipita vermifera]|nr:hypothetical protein CPB86DRAFT_790416 [Serendipita vermifera]
MNSLLNLDPNPNQLKNRVPTPKEQEILRRNIKREEKKLDELDAEISTLKEEVAGYRDHMQDLKLTLQAAEKLRLNCEKISSSLNELSSKIVWDERTTDTDRSTIPTYHRVNSIATDLEDEHNSYLQKTQSAIEKARQELQSAQEEVDSIGSLLHSTTHSLNYRLELRSHVYENICQMRDLIGPRRRMPNELWSKIFWERVTKDEEKYEITWRQEAAPYTTLKLTWVCRLWRQIVTNEPSLWRYIAIPQDPNVSNTHVEKFNHFRKHLKEHLPSIYMLPGRKCTGSGTTALKDLLSGFPSIKLLELQMTPKSSSLLALLTESEFHIEKLIFVNSPYGSTTATGTYLSCRAMKNVKNLVCYSTRPRIAMEDLQGERPQLHSLYLRSSALDNKELIMFLEGSGVERLEFILKEGWTQDMNDAVDQDVALTRLRRVVAPLEVVASIFNSHVFLPNIQALSVTHLSKLRGEEALEKWITFITAHDRKDLVTSLTLTGLPRTDSPVEAANMFKNFLQQVPNISHLTLNGENVVPSLKGMTEAKSVPTALAELRIHSSKDVTEEDIHAFLQTLSANRSNLLSLKIVGCSLISEDAKQRLDLAYHALDKKGEPTN